MGHDFDSLGISVIPLWKDQSGTPSHFPAAWCVRMGDYDNKNAKPELNTIFYDSLAAQDWPDFVGVIRLFQGKAKLERSHAQWLSGAQEHSQEGPRLKNAAVIQHVIENPIGPACHLRAFESIVASRVRRRILVSGEKCKGLAEAVSRIVEVTVQSMYGYRLLPSRRHLHCLPGLFSRHRNSTPASQSSCQ